MVRAAARIVVSLWLLAFAGHAALASKRVALVIGNGAYANAPTLTNPKNDAEDMAGALKGLGFTVILGTDLDKRSMDRKILEFASALSGAEVGVFHYSGHGLQVAGVNYLVPVDASLETAAALDFEAVPLGLVQRTMEREAKTNILFLDACRNNPLTRNLARALGTRSTDVGHGLAPVESGAGTLISFSTQPGNVALDGEGRNSPYSGPLVKAISTPGEDVLSMLTGVRNAVMATTGDKQVPWDNNALRAKFYFNPAEAAPPQEQARSSEAAQAWAEIKNLNDPLVFEAFRKQYGSSNPLFDSLASRRLIELKQNQEASPQQPVGPAPLDPLKKRKSLVDGGMPVVIGDTYKEVKAAYPIAPVPEPISGQYKHSTSVRLEDLGIWFFFDDNKKIYTIRLDQPWHGSVRGIRIGDTKEKIASILGKPRLFDNAYLYDNVDGLFVRFDFDESGRVYSIMF